VKVFTDHTRAVYALSFCPDGIGWLPGVEMVGVHVYDVEVTWVFTAPLYPPLTSYLEEREGMVMVRR